jgi:hypothetical protein
MKRLTIIAVLLFMLALACQSTSDTNPTEPPAGQAQPAQGKRCGDGVCDGPENANNCPQDCTSGVQPTEPPVATQPPSSGQPKSGQQPTNTTGATTSCSDLATFFSDVTVPDGTEFSPGDTFVKTWRLKNIGTCPWTPNYKLAFQSGDKMGGPSVKALSSSPVAAGQTAEVSVNLTAPSSIGSYRGYWIIQNASGTQIEIDNSAQNNFWVDIDVVLTGVPVTSDFTIVYDNVHSCSGNDYVTFKIGITGTKSFQSMNIKITDLDTSTTLLHVSGINPFIMNATGCGPGVDTVSPGGVYYIIANLGTPPPSGTNARVALKMCTQPALAGTCVTEHYEFTVP